MCIHKLIDNFLHFCLKQVSDLSIGTNCTNGLFPFSCCSGNRFRSILSILRGDRIHRKVSRGQLLMSCRPSKHRLFQRWYYRLVVVCRRYRGTLEVEWDFLSLQITISQTQLYYMEKRKRNIKQRVRKRAGSGGERRRWE